MFNSADSSEYVHIYSKDPALNQEHEKFNWDNWVDTGDDEFIPCHPGSRPVRFILRPLSFRERTRAQKLSLADRGDEAALYLVAHALIGIDTLVVDGQPVELEKTMDANSGREIVSEKFIDIIGRKDDGALFWELTRRINRQEFGDPKS